MNQGHVRKTCETHTRAGTHVNIFDVCGQTHTRKLDDLFVLELLFFLIQLAHNIYL